MGRKILSMLAVITVVLGTRSDVIAAPSQSAMAVVRGEGGVNGTIRFQSKGNQLEVTAEVSGLTAKEHAIHIHEFGDCSAADFSSAGPHYNPLGHKHGAPTSTDRHVGDLGNLQADQNGQVRRVTLDPLLSLDGAHSIVGRAVIVHERADDLKTDPTGDAGGRIACGVIGLTK